MGLKQFFSSLQSTPSKVPQLLSIPAANTEQEEYLDKTFIRNENYFTVRLNEMYLQSKRQWLTEFEPTVLCLTNYIYGDQEIENPFIVGRNLTQGGMKETDDGMLFKDTKVAGTHPFRGGRIVISMALCKSINKDYLKDTLEFIQSVTSIFNENISTLVGNYLKGSKVIIKGVDKLLDSKELEPLFGFRIEFDIDANDQFSPGYFVAIKSDVQYDPKLFFVKGRQLYYGNNSESADKFTNEEYMLFSVMCTKERTDYDTLPFNKSYKNILEQVRINDPSDEFKKILNSMFKALNIELENSPDLSPAQAEKIAVEYFNTVKKLMKPDLTFGKSKSIKKDFWSELDAKIDAM